MIKADKYYIENLNQIIDEKNMDINPRPKYKDGIPAHTFFITQVFEKYDLTKNEYPITTLRNTAIKTGIKEILWIYQKQSNDLKDARELGINWWDEWNIGDDTIGQRYGATVKKYNLIDDLIKGLVKDPFGRRHILNLYQYSDLKETTGLYPCAYETIWSVRLKNGIYYLDMTLVQRSNDYITAGYINKIQYVALMHMIASHLRLVTESIFEVGTFGHYVHNLHIYDRHLDACNEILEKTPENIQPYISIKEDKLFNEFTIDDFKIHNNIGKKIMSNLEIAI